MSILLLLLGLTLQGQERNDSIRVDINGKAYCLSPAKTGSRPADFPLELSVKSSTAGNTPITVVQLKNPGRDTVQLSNFLPLSQQDGTVYITGLGKHPLSRTHLFRPGRQPVNVICPDNAWELGFAAVPRATGGHRVSLSRRRTESITRGQRKRFETILYPGGSVEYTIWSADIPGTWQEGLRWAFQEQLLFDTDSIDPTLYLREDLQWFRKAYIIHLFMGWDKDVYDPSLGRYTLPDFVRKGLTRYGGDDVVCLWPTWPTLGMDPRNQFDMYRSMPGGLAALKALGDSLRSLGTRFFVAYNPWDESTRREDHLGGLRELIRETGADGVVLDTRGASSRELQEAADSARPGVIMYSEGMAVPKDMSHILAGRVHNALYYPPILNLHKLIKPEFGIFRVAERYKEPVDREISLSLFNGYGTEFNVFAAGEPEWAEAQYRYLGKTTRILREHQAAFTEGRSTPLLDIAADSIWVNEWRLPHKTIYTVYAVQPQGIRKPLLPIRVRPGWHVVDLWHHRNLHAPEKNGTALVDLETAAFNADKLGTNQEGAVDVIGHFPILLHLNRQGDSLHLRATQGDEIRLWQGVPEYGKTPLRLAPRDTVMSWTSLFGWYEGRVIAQLFRKNELIDETIVDLVPGTPRRITSPGKTIPATNTPSGMIPVPGGRFRFRTTHGDDFIPYPRDSEDSLVQVPAFYIDTYPVTNLQFARFLAASGYQPRDSTAVLRHWVNGKPKPGEEQFPVIYVSLEDASAYAAWAGKRLPTEVEWQYAAQAGRNLEWPWIQEKPVTRTVEKVTETLSVFSLSGIDSNRCNLGNGQLYPVGSYPAGANPWGLQDLTGCIWQLTSDIYQAGQYRYIMLKGGSYFKPSSSWWYVQGGPRELHYRQMLLRVSPGFERNATIGFRCVKDKKSVK